MSGRGLVVPPRRPRVISPGTGATPRRRPPRHPVHHRDRAAVVDGVRRAADPGRPPLGVGRRVLRQVRVVQVREDREVDQAERLVPTRRRSPRRHEVAPDARRQHHASGAHSEPHRVGQRRQQLDHPRLAHPVREVERVATAHQQHVGGAHPRHPLVVTEARQGGQLEQPDRAPPELGHRAARLGPGHEVPGALRPGHGVRRRRDAQRVRLLDGLAEHAHQGVADPGARHAGRRQEQPHRAPRALGRGTGGRAPANVAPRRPHGPAFTGSRTG